jgi:hypothetical protein
LEPLPRAALGTRLQCALEFVSRFPEAGAHPESSLIPWPPTMSPVEVLEWLVTDWWDRHGRDLAVSLWQAQLWNEFLAQRK